MIDAFPVRRYCSWVPSIQNTPSMFGFERIWVHLGVRTSVVARRSGSEGEAFAPRNSRLMQLRTRGMSFASIDANWKAGSVNEFSGFVFDKQRSKSHWLVCLLSRSPWRAQLSIVGQSSWYSPGKLWLWYRDKEMNVPTNLDAPVFQLVACNRGLETEMMSVNFKLSAYELLMWFCFRTPRTFCHHFHPIIMITMI